MEEGNFMRITNAKVKVCKVQVLGLNRTKNDIVTEQVKDVLKSENLLELVANSLESVDRLKSLNAFKEVNLEFGACRNKMGKIDGTAVTFRVKENGLIASSISANAGTQSGDANLSFSLRNIFGRAEQLKVVSTTAFPQWGQTIQLELTKPYYKDITRQFCAGLGTTNFKQPPCGYQENIYEQKVQMQCFSRLGHHTFGWFCDWRELFGFDNGVPMSIRKDAGHSLKSSLKHVLVTDNRDDPLLPSEGYLTKLTHEVAGLGGDICFSKAEVQTQMFKEIFPEWVLGLSFWGGLLKPFSPSKINDRFLLGGSTTLRGFEMWGVGPHRHGYSYGGEAYWATGLHLFLPLPFTSGEFFRRIRFHGFLTAGNLNELCSLSSFLNLLKETRLSGGFGMHCRLGIAQIELNYAIPLRAQSHDRLKPGLQFGIGLDML
ncbi:PREDICTED: sorting and assembly machinery component 50 homolog [Amphimedon queenslandica]|uniref:Bacterial surface antigen (D15) domain-containing protein n=1 Tax=Amphimedon queenslandica TaxID=400682 RepID=A0A1X7VET6_AMPQE|nr:PREDICTED: sorting and assembly machinery component 50 homolog [Amphimedon queenslandica]|eukprot:XP_019849234.1 PREDICTED: sorting and assembly machinery component 50 homolog [Amphimedon queenslandica]